MVSIIAGWSDDDGSEHGDECVARHDIGAERLDVGDDLGVVGDHHHRTGRREPAYLVTDHVVGDHSLGRPHDANEPTPGRVGSENRCAVEHHRDVGGEPPCHIFQCVEQMRSLGIERSIRPGQLRDVVAVDEDDGL